MPVGLDKTSLRLAMRQKLKTHTEALQGKAWRGWYARFRQTSDERRLGKRLTGLLSESAPQVLAAYYPMPGELDLLVFLRALHSKGWIITLPCIPEDAADRQMRFCRWAPGDAVVKNRLGIQEPAQKSEMIPSVILVPLVAYDRQARRLGYGKGFYDTTLHALSADGLPRITLGIGHEFQEVDYIPTEPHDMALTAIVTPHRVLAPPVSVTQS